MSGGQAKRTTALSASVMISKKQRHCLRQLLTFLSKTFMPLPFLCFIVIVLKCYCIAFLASSYFAHIQVSSFITFLCSKLYMI